MSGSAKRVTAVIVTYQSGGTIAAALDQLKGSGVAVVVVDNASSDGTADLIERSHPWVTLVRSGENLGFGRGCNLGFTHVVTPYVLMLNPDAVMSAESVDTLVAWMESHPKAAIAAPAIIENDRSLQAAGLLTTPGTLIRSALGARDTYPDRRTIEPGAAPFRTPWVCGAAMLIRSDIYRALGGFDERFFLYFEETDLCRRAAAGGYEIWAVGESTARHIGGASAKKTGEKLQSSCISDHFYRSRFYYLVKQYGWIQGVGAEVIAGSMQMARHLRARLLRRDSGDAPAQRGRPFLRFPEPPRGLT